MSIWDDFLDLFKTKEQQNKEKDEEYYAILDDEKELMNKLNGLRTEYEASLPKDEIVDHDAILEKFNKVEKVDNTLSNEKLDEIAKQEAYEGYDDVLSEIKKTFENSINKNKQDKDKVNENAKNELISLGNKFATNKNNIKDKMSKNGLYYSTINEGLNKENEKELANNVKRNEENKRNSLLKLDEEIKEIENKKDEAMKKLDADKYKKYTDLLSDLTEKRDKERQKILEYNENLKTEKIKFDQNREKLIKELEEKDRKAKTEKDKLIAEQEKIYGYTGEKKENYDKRYDLAFEFYSSLPKDIALRAVKSNPTLKGYLGNYYDTLLSAMHERAGEKSLFG